MIGLVRVSTDKQHESGLGEQAQALSIERLRAQLGAELIQTYTEVESGKHNSIDRRPRLREAAEHAREIGGILVIAKLDRLVRSTSVLEYLKQTGVRFIACDNPHANEMTIDILVAVAAGEARMTSQRTRDALAAYKANGRVSRKTRERYPQGAPDEIVAATAGKLGASLPQCKNLTGAGRLKGRIRAIATRRKRSADHAEPILRVIDHLISDEPTLSLRDLAKRLNSRNRRTPTGRLWGPGQVKRILDRRKRADP
jgi:DNA invertase Pin-like site-specific DNA recombinase